MELTRRQFIIGGSIAITLIGLGLPRLKLGWTQAKEFAKTVKLKTACEITSVCPYCAVGCGIIVATNVEQNEIVNLEGWSEHPINEGSLCSKGAAVRQIPVNPQRLTKPLHRRPYSTKWEEISWEQAIDMITDRIIKTRNETFVIRNSNKDIVNRTEGIACLGGAVLSNEECYLLIKLMRALGLVYIEHQARI